MSQLTVIGSGGSGGTNVQTLTGNSGGAVGPSAGNINVVGSGGVVVTGNPGTHTLTVSSAGSVELPCVAATVVDLNATYNNGTAGVGATLTNNGTQAALVIDGVTLGLFNRVLVKNQITDSENGIYEVSDVGSVSTNWVLTRTSDYNTPAQIQPGDLVPVQQGTVNINSLWVELATVTTIGLDSIIFTAYVAQAINTADADTGSATGTTVTWAGGNNIATSASGSTLTIDLDGTTNHCLQVGNATGSLTSLAAATDGQIAIGSTGADPVIAAISAGSGITVTNAPGSITIAATGLTTIAYTGIDNTDTPYTVLSGDYYIGADTTGGVISVLFPNAPTTGRVYIVKDSAGTAATSNITVTTVGGAVLLDGAATYVMNTAYQAAQFVFNGASYEVF